MCPLAHAFAMQSKYLGYKQRLEFPFHQLALAAAFTLGMVMFHGLVACRGPQSRRCRTYWLRTSSQALHTPSPFGLSPGDGDARERSALVATRTKQTLLSPYRERRARLMFEEKCPPRSTPFIFYGCVARCSYVWRQSLGLIDAV